MKKYFRKTHSYYVRMLIMLALGNFIVVSCTDDYLYDNKEPDWLGASIYDYLKTKGNFNYYLWLVDQTGQNKGVLQRTGSKTAFVANDDAFRAFFKQNDWNVSDTSKLTDIQKRKLVNFSLLPNSVLTQQLPNYNSNGTLVEGSAMRMVSSCTWFENISFDTLSQIPPVNKWNSYWAPFKSTGIYLLKDESVLPLAYFTQPFIAKNALDNDTSIVSGGKFRNVDDIYVFNHKVINKDIPCKNGYINEIDGVLAAPKNMAQYIFDNPETKTFSNLLERFSAPFVNENTYKGNNLYVKRYFAASGGSAYLPNSEFVADKNSPAPYLLPFDPGWNSYSNGVMQADMAAMFVPSDNAMNAWLNSDIGKLLKNRFGSWDNIPNSIVLKFLTRNMRSSLVETVPSKFSRMVDNVNYPYIYVDNGVNKALSLSDVKNTYMGANGVVYVLNRVFPPVDYVSVYSPVLFASNTKILNWAISNIDYAAADNTTYALYQLYLNSLTSKYALFVPTDDLFSNYIDPIAFGQSKPGVIKFRFDDSKNAVMADIYAYPYVDGSLPVTTVDGSIRTSNTSDDGSSYYFVRNRLWALLDRHIVINDIKNDGFYITKSNEIIKVSNVNTNSMTVAGGGDLSAGGSCSLYKNSTDSAVFNQSNGHTYFLDKPIQPALNSVYTTLQQNPAFSEFFELLAGAGNYTSLGISGVFTQQGINQGVSFLKTYNYTLYVPSNTAVQAAFANGTLTRWSDIDAMTDGAAKIAAVNNNIRVLRYHFQDSAVFVGNNYNNKFLSATLRTSNDPASIFGTSVNKFYQLKVHANNGTVNLTTESGATATVTSDPTLSNIVAKDYVFGSPSATTSLAPSQFGSIDNTITGTYPFVKSRITTSSSIVIHQINNVLTFK